jgi:uncharacterized protein (DUF2267 family)
MEYEEIIDAASRSAGGMDRDAAGRAVQATLQTLAERVGGGEARQILRELPAQLKPSMLNDSDAVTFGIDEFLHRVAQREGTDAETALRHARGVFDALGDALSPEVTARLAASLPQTFAPLVAEARNQFFDILPASQFWDRVCARLGVNNAQARRITGAVLETLAERIARGQATDLIAQLDPPLHPALLRGVESGSPEAQHMAEEEFLGRVAGREEASMAEADLFDQVTAHVRAVFATLAEAVGAEEWSDVTAELPADYQDLIPPADSRLPRPQPVPPMVSGHKKVQRLPPPGEPLLLSPAAGRAHVLRRDDEMAFHPGDSRRGSGRGPRGGCLAHGVHVAEQPGGVVGHLDLDVPGVDLGLALERLLDLRLDVRRIRRRPDADQVGHADHPADVTHHPLDLVPLVFKVDVALEGNPALFHPGVYPSLRDPHVPFQDVRDRPGNVGVVPPGAGQPDVEVVGDGLDAVDALGRAGTGQLL